MKENGSIHEKAIKRYLKHGESDVLNDVLKKKPCYESENIRISDHAIDLWRACEKLAENKEDMDFFINDIFYEVACVASGFAIRRIAYAMGVKEETLIDLFCDSFRGDGTKRPKAFRKKGEIIEGLIKERLGYIRMEFDKMERLQAVDND